MYKYLIPPKEKEANPGSVMVTNVDEMKPNSGKIIRYGRKPVILIRIPNGEFQAFSAICTHLDCIVQYREDLEHIWCACHNGHYNLRGVNIAGPPPRPLEEYEVNIKKNKVFVSRKS
jgi:cytochrome b6-f complex iron-sulfur subunit